MKKLFHLIALALLFTANKAAAQTTSPLRNKIQQIISAKKAVVGVSIMGDNGKDTLSINGDGHFPLQSVFKFHIALTVLAQIDKGKFFLDQKIKIEKKDLLPNLYSPIREKYPDGVTLPISEVLAYSVSESDNVACDILLELIGGPRVVEDYLKKNNIEDVSIKINEATQQANWDLQFQNWTTPKSANEVLSKFYYNKTRLLSPKMYGFIWKIMRDTKTGKDRLKGQLPANTVVAHKTGTSGTNKAGLTAAVNDIGVVFLPDGHYFFISVFVTNSKENTDTNEKIIAAISKLAWDYFKARAK